MNVSVVCLKHISASRKKIDAKKNNVASCKIVYSIDWFQICWRGDLSLKDYGFKYKSWFENDNFSNSACYIV